LLEERGKGTNLRLSREFDSYPESPLWRKLLLLHHSAPGVPTSGLLKNRVAAIKNFLWHRCRGSSRRFFTFVSFYFALDFAIVFLSMLSFVILAMASASKVKMMLAISSSTLMSPC
jgi:hypothetical protein